MKKGLLALVALMSLTAGAQKQGEVSYTTKINMHAELPDDEHSEMIKQMIPEFQEMQNVLLFTETESLYANDESDEGDEAIEENDGDVQIKIEMDTPEEKVYTDVANGIIVQQRDLMGKTFLIKDTLQASDWHVSDEQKLVSGVMCQKAELYTDSDTIVAWFTPQIPVSTGPAGFAGLPGLIVHVSMDGGNYQITATNIVKRPIGKKEIKAPTKGKTITEEEFNALQERKMKELQEQFGGDGGTVIMISE